MAKKAEGICELARKCTTDKQKKALRRKVQSYKFISPKTLRRVMKLTK